MAPGGGRGGQPGPFGGKVCVQSPALVRVLAVTEHVGAAPQGPRHLGPAAVPRGLVGGVGRREPGRHREVVGGGVRERPGGQLAALVQRETALGHRGEHVGVPGRVDDDGHRAVILGGGPDHRRAADVDLLHALPGRGAGRDRGLERVQVRHEQLERLDAELGQLGLVRGVRGIREQARVHPGVQRLDPPVQALGEAGQLLHWRDRHPGGGDPGRGGAGGDDLDAGRVQPGRQLLKTGLVVDADRAPA